MMKRHLAGIAMVVILCCVSASSAKAHPSAAEHWQDLRYVFSAKEPIQASEAKLNLIGKRLNKQVKSALINLVVLIRVCLRVSNGKQVYCSQYLLSKSICLHEEQTIDVILIVVGIIPTRMMLRMEIG